ncbi:DUF6193 family natural product biosynthesis protein [Streptomyces sp. NPDC007206]|uniref:DUF6193 family natural product biosynthesis protein n=1 Tax=Streptomyces sp. NPDC007206 TaxID=3154317 RepID=UPI00340FE206
MAASREPAALYPDIATQGSLAAALQAVADKEDLTVSFQASNSDPLLHASVRSVVPHRTVMTVSAWAVERRWSIRGCESFQDLALVEGNTQDLAQVAQAAQAWHDAVELSEIRRAAPFVHLTGRFEVPDHDPERLTESEWQQLRTEASEVDWPEYRALIEAAYAEPALRGLYPFTSHWTLRFSTSTRPRLTVVPLCLHPHRQKPYTLSTLYMGEVVAEAPSAAETVSMALRHLPSGLGPVTSGANRTGRVRAR